MNNLKFQYMKKVILIILFLVSYLTNCQIKATVIDSKTGRVIPYVNIWIKDKNIGTTSNEEGKFVLNNIEKFQKIVFSAIGYETLTLKASTIGNKVKLKPKITVLPKVIISYRKKTKEITIGKFKKSKINFYFSCGKNPWIVARYFNYKTEYDTTPFLKTIRILTKSKVKNSKFIVRLYNVNKDGKPEGYLYNKNIIGVAKKGKHITTIDLSNLKIKFPKQGFFIAIEWLIIAPNKHRFKYKMNDIIFKEISYEPSIGTIPSKTNENSWIFIGGKWKKVWKNNGPLKRYRNKYNLPAIELTLTN